jgi:hypothetical protein
VQQGQAGQVLAQNQTGDLSADQQVITGTEVVKLLESLEVAVKVATMPANDAKEALGCLEMAKFDVLVVGISFCIENYKNTLLVKLEVSHESKISGILSPDYSFAVG